MQVIGGICVQLYYRNLSWGLLCFLYWIHSNFWKSKLTKKLLPFYNHTLIGLAGQDNQQLKPSLGKFVHRTISKPYPFISHFIHFVSFFSNIYVSVPYILFTYLHMHHFYITVIAIAITLYLAGVLSTCPAPKQSWKLLCTCLNLICGHILWSSC